MYKDKEVKELFDLLGRHKSLTFQSQLDLQKELKARGLSNEGAELDSTIVKTSAIIRNFRYLKDLGFRISEDADSLKISRTTQAKVIDVAAVVLGLFLSLYGLVKLLSITLFAPEGNQDFSFSYLLSIAFYGGMIILGVKFLNGVKRFFDFLGFELTKSVKGIFLKKRFDLKLEERQVEASGLQLERYKDRLILKLDEHDLLDANANDIVQRMTIESLYDKLRN